MLAILLMLAAAATVMAANAPPVDKAWSVLTEGAEHKSSDKRTKAIHALGLIKQNQRAQRMAEKALSDDNTDVRVEGATALGRMGADSARPRLRDLLKDKEGKVVIAAANALYLLMDPAAYEVFYALLTGKRKAGAGLLQTQLNTFRNRRQMEAFLFQTGIGFVPFGGMSYEAWKTITHDTATPIRVAAAEKLATDPDPKSAQALEKSCFDSKWQVRLASVDAIAKRGDPSLLTSVDLLLSDDNDSVRDEAAAAIILLAAAPGGPAALHRDQPKGQ